MFRFNVSILRMRYSQDRISIFIEFSKTCNRTKFNFVIDNAPISVGGRVLKGSLKEALKGAKGASAMSTAGHGTSRTSLIYNNEIIINKRKRNEGQISEASISLGRSIYQKLLLGIV